AFSHHESERAQSESLTGKVPFARTWMHTGLVRYEGRKMSKSLGNLVLISQALERAPAAAVRLYLASHRYGRDWEFSWSGLARATRLAERVRAVLAGERTGVGAAQPGQHGAHTLSQPGGPRQTRRLEEHTSESSHGSSS